MLPDNALNNMFKFGIAGAVVGILAGAVTSFAAKQAAPETIEAAKEANELPEKDYEQQKHMLENKHTSKPEKPKELTLEDVMNKENVTYVQNDAHMRQLFDDLFIFGKHNIDVYAKIMRNANALVFLYKKVHTETPTGGQKGNSHRFKYNIREGLKLLERELVGQRLEAGAAVGQSSVFIDGFRDAASDLLTHVVALDDHITKQVESVLGVHT